jgi:hypothetical protein
MIVEFPNVGWMHGRRGRSGRRRRSCREGRRWSGSASST